MDQYGTIIRIGFAILRDLSFPDALERSQISNKNLLITKVVVTKLRPVLLNEVLEKDIIAPTVDDLR